MSVRLNYKIIVIAMTLSLSAADVAACGRAFPNYVLDGGDDIVIKAPIANFEKEIERIEPPMQPQFKANSELNYNTEVADFQAAVGWDNLGQGQRERILEIYYTARRLASKQRTTRRLWEKQKERPREGSGLEEPAPPQFYPRSLPGGLPGEFEDYICGAAYYYGGQKEEAITAWYNLLRRPMRERMYKSTWAAYMIGKTLLEDEPDKAVEWCEFVRELAKAGCVDSMALASSSLGLEALAEINRANYGRALELYVAQRATGDPRTTNWMRKASRKALEAEVEVLSQSATNSTGRRVLTAYVISRQRFRDPAPPPEVAAKWVQAVERAGVELVEDADRLAWAAYQGGEMELAQRWVAVAARDSIMTQWIESKLFLRAGRISEAAERLGAIVSKFGPVKQPRTHYVYRNWRKWALGTYPIAEVARGELAVLLVACRRYVEALDVLIEGGFWGDACYVAENVLTADELIAYVDGNWPALSEEVCSNESYERNETTDPNWFNVRIRFLLARYLAQLGRYEEARPYYPPRWQKRLDLYVEAIQTGEDQRLPKEQRAAAYWRAACMAHSRGWGRGLHGTERSFGYTSYGRTGTTRVEPDFAKFVPISEDERRRLQEHGLPNEGFSLRHVASGYAWKAAEFMPNNSDETARVLCIGGSWLASQHPKEADVFYKALVRRCRKTKLGQEADKLRWFPSAGRFNLKKFLEEIDP